MFKMWIIIMNYIFNYYDNFNRSDIEVAKAFSQGQLAVIFPLAHLVELDIFPRILVDCAIRQSVRVVATVHEGALSLSLVKQATRNLLDYLFVLLNESNLFWATFYEVSRWNHQVTVSTADRASTEVMLTRFFIVC